MDKGRQRHLDQELADFFWKGSDSKQSRQCEPHMGLCHIFFPPPPPPQPFKNVKNIFRPARAGRGAEVFPAPDLHSWAAEWKAVGYPPRLNLERLRGEGGGVLRSRVSRELARPRGGRGAGWPHGKEPGDTQT